MNAPAKTPNILEPRPLYGIGTVARLTGLKPDTLRVWERRYGLGASYKSASGRRLFTQSDLEHLQLITALVEDGVRIGEIASSDRKTLELLVSNRGSRMSKAIPRSKVEGRLRGCRALPVVRRTPRLFVRYQRLPIAYAACECSGYTRRG